MDGRPIRTGERGPRPPFPPREKGMRGGILGMAMAGLVLLTTPAAADHIDPDQLFANVCGFCHEDGGRRAGKGPQLMCTTRSDDFLRNRIKRGRPGRMPAFGWLEDAAIGEIIAYIRSLGPCPPPDEGTTP